MSALEDWGIGQLGELCSIEIGGTPSRNVPRYWDESKESGNLWSSIKDLSAKTIISTEEQITDEGVRHSNVKLQAKGNVLLSFKLTIGRVAKAGIPLYTNEAIAGIASSQIEHDFLFYGLQQWDLLRGVDQAIKGATLNKKKLKQIEFEYPLRKSEQTKIAEILSTVDRAIEQTEALIAKQQRIKTGLMQDLLTRGIDEHGNLRSEETHEFKDSPLGRIPVEWDCEELGIRLMDIEQGWSPDCENEPAAQGEWGVLKTTAVLREGYQASENKALPSSLAPRPRHEVRTGDLLMTRAGPNSRVGVAAYVYDTQQKLMLSDKLYRLIPDIVADSEFVALAISSFQSQRHLSTLKTGLAESQTNISQEIVRQLLIGFPPKPEQHRIAEMLRFSSDRLEADRRNLSKLRSIKTALMHDLLTGKKRVTPLLEPQDTSVQTP